MKTKMMLALVVALVGCDKAPAPAPAPANVPAEKPAAAAPANVPANLPVTPKTDAEKTVVDVAVGSPDHTTLVAAIKAADLVTSLNSPGGVYTIFAPTNAAFAKLPKGTVEGLLVPEKKADLKLVLQHHAAVPIMQLKDFKDGQVMGMADGTKVTFHVKGNKVQVNDANIIASIPASNGIVHVIDAVLVPTPKAP